MKKTFNKTFFCPKCGAKTFHREIHKRFLCKSCGFTYYVNAATAVVGIIFNSKKKILLTVRKKDPAAGKLDFPGGFADINESAEKALEREIKEELNLDVDSLRYLTSIPNTYLYKDVLYHTIDLYYLCKVNNFKDISANDDITGYVFMDPKKINIEKDIGLESPKIFLREKFDLIFDNY